MTREEAWQVFLAVLAAARRRLNHEQIDYLLAHRGRAALFEATLRHLGHP